MELRIRAFEIKDEPAVIALWEACGLVVPWNDPKKDIGRKMSVNPELFLVGLLGDEVVASVMAGYEGHRGSVNYVAVTPAHRGKGFGCRMLEAAEARLKEWGCPKINLMVRTTNTSVIEFYERVGFSLDPVVCLSKRLKSDE